MVNWKSIAVVFGLFIGGTMLTSCDDAKTKKAEDADAAVEVVEEATTEVEVEEATTEVVADSTEAVVEEGAAVEEVAEEATEEATEEQK
ncbi:MAG: hypothetical protein ABFR62_05580 [Bacteroidota bacterium]